MSKYIPTLRPDQIKACMEMELTYKAGTHIFLHDYKPSDYKYSLTCLDDGFAQIMQDSCVQLNYDVLEKQYHKGMDDRVTLIITPSETAVEHFYDWREREISGG